MSDRAVSSIVYFEGEGRRNLVQVIRTVKKAFRKRSDIRTYKLVIFTAHGEGPAIAYNQLQEYDPQIIAVTFPPSFFIKRGEEIIHPHIHPKLRAFFNGVNVRVITGRLPFDQVEGIQVHNDQMKLIRDVLSLFGGSFELCVQAVLQACDTGAVEIGEKVVGMSGDCAAIITASTTQKFLSIKEGLAINEILCKPRNLTIARRKAPAEPARARSLFEPSGPALTPRAPKILPKG